MVFKTKKDIVGLYDKIARMKLKRFKMKDSKMKKVFK